MYNFLNIKEIIFEFEDKQVSLKVNEKMSLLNRKEEFLVVDENGNYEEMPVYSSYIYRDHNAIKLYFQKIFEKGEKDIGKSIPLRVNVVYSFDNEMHELIQQINYTLSIYEGRNMGSKLLRRLFPEM